ncbi:uncharacterized protein LOC130728794 [Lotus japonicus]|uniref:uncharacterized protein LOC130728794 n=1 Tax=Lotus japonicus TaxID=34305 RepID=UPI002585D74F|nr:uncharacterized protein LOC130728794 [Lotus japonicus]
MKRSENDKSNLVGSSSEQESHIHKKKGRKDIEVMDGNVADSEEVHVFDEKQQSKMKKRKNYDDVLPTGIREVGSSKRSKKGKMTEDGELKNSEGGHRTEEEDDDQGQKMEKKKKELSEESQHNEYDGFKSNEGGDDDQGKKMKKKNKKKLSEESQQNECDRFKSNEGEDDDQGKKMKKNKKKKLIEESKSKEEDNKFRSNEGEDGDQGKMMKKKKLRDKRKNKNSEFNSNGGGSSSARVKAGDANAHGVVTAVGDQSKNMKTKKKAKEDTGESSNPAAYDGTSKPKRVTFSDQVEVCDDILVRGKRFTPEEDEKIKEAVFDYIESHGLGDEGLDMILHCKSHPEVRDCWKEIGAVLPKRPHISVYYRAHILFERDETRKWTPDEFEVLRKLQNQHGSDWKKIAGVLGKHPVHVKDAWRRIRQTDTNKGRWTQDEYQQLFDLVNKDLRARAAEECRKSKHGMLRDNVSWEAISNKFGARNGARCCLKWYKQLTSPMVADGVWSDTDDYRLLNALYTLDAYSMEEVDWDNLLEHRSGDMSRKRWNQMVQYIGQHGTKSFAEQVEILAKRFCPDLLEAREAFDSKPVVG